MSSTRKGAGAVRPGAALAVLAAAQFAVALSTSIVNVALPAVRDGVGLSGTGMSWVVNSYGLAFGALLLLGGRTADLVGGAASSSEASRCSPRPRSPRASPPARGR